MGEPVDVIAQPTPNPNSMKFTLNRAVVEQGSQSFMNPEQAQGSPLAQRLFQINGVKSLFFLNNFITVTRDPSVDWQDIAGEVEAAIREHFQS